jgi:predicted nucleic acid-binding Zn ribbon protein
MKRGKKRGLHKLPSRLMKRMTAEENDAEREEREMSIDWLNANKGRTQYKEVVYLIGEIEKAREATPTISMLQWAQAEASGHPTAAVSWNKIHLINSLLKKFKLYPRIVGRRKVGGHSKERLAHSRLMWEWWPERDSTAKVVHAIVRLEQQGLWYSFRQCLPCGKWILTTRRRQRFCSTQCREKTFRSTEEGRKKRAAYMRTYRSQPINR